MTQLSIIFLGTGGSWPSVKRNVASIAVKRGSEILLFDCGEGTQRQFQKSSLSYMQISHVFITHFHGDHFLGLPGLIQTMQLNDREKPLDIYGPKGIDDIVVKLVTLGYFKPRYPIITHELNEGDVLSFKGYDIEVLGVEHNIPALSYALIEHQRPGKFNKPQAFRLGIPEGPLFSKLQRGHTITLDDGTKITPELVLGPQRPGRKIVYSGDTRPLKKMINFARNADVLIHEATFSSEHADIASEYAHTLAGEAAHIAQEAQVKCLFLVHISPRYLNVESFENDTKSVFPQTFIPKDFDEFTVRLSK